MKLHSLLQLTVLSDYNSTVHRSAREFCTPVHSRWLSVLPFPQPNYTWLFLLAVNRYNYDFRLTLTRSFCLVFFFFFFSFFNCSFCNFKRPAAVVSHALGYRVPLFN